MALDQELGEICNMVQDLSAIDNIRAVIKHWEPLPIAPTATNSDRFSS